MLCAHGPSATKAVTARNLVLLNIDDLLDVENDLLDTDDDLLQELDLGTAQAATPAAMPVSTGTLSQADSGTTTTKRKGRQPGSRNKKTLQREAAIAGAMQALQAGGTHCRLPCKDKMVAHKFKIKARSAAGQLAQRIRLQERRSHRSGLPVVTAQCFSAYFFGMFSRMPILTSSTERQSLSLRFGAGHAGAGSSATSAETSIALELISGQIQIIAA